MMKRIIRFYQTAEGRSPVEEYLKKLNDRTLSKVLAVFKLIETQEIVPAQYFKKLRGHELWECRVGLAGRSYRFMGFWDKGAVILLTHGFEKKSQKTPDREIKRALDYKADWQRRAR